MKKSIKLLTLSLLTAGMVASCGGDPGPAGPQTDWSDEQKAAMREQLYGEALPWVDDQPELKWTSGNGYFMALGDEVEYTDLAAYAAKFTADPEDGWELASSYKDATTGHVIMYTYEKKVEVEGEGERYVQAQFASIDSKYYFVENGNFLLYAEDPYYYTWNEAAVKYGNYVSSEFKSEFIAIPEVAADRYEFYDSTTKEGVPFALLNCYTSDTEAAEKFYAALGLSEDEWHVYPGHEDEEEEIFFYMADSPDGKYGIQYYYDSEDGCLTIFVSEANYLYEFPLAELNAAIKNTGSELEAVALEGYRYDVLSGTGYFYVMVYVDQIPAKTDLGYTDLLLAADWYSNGLVESVQMYVAEDHPHYEDVVASLRYFFLPNEDQDENPGGRLVIGVEKGTAFLDTLPVSDLQSYTYNYFYSDEVIPDVDVATLYVTNLNMDCVGIYYDSTEPDGGYSGILTEAGWNVSFYTSELEDGTVVFYAFSPDYYYGISYTHLGDQLAIQYFDSYEMEYEVGEWAGVEKAIEELFAISDAYAFEIPALSVASAEAYFAVNMVPDSDGYPEGTWVYIEGATQSEFETYISSLTTAGWVVDEDSTLEAGHAKKDDEGAYYGYVEIKWYGMQDADENWYFAIELFYTSAKPEKFADFPADLVNAFLSSEGYEGTAVNFGTFDITLDEGYFEIQDYSEYGYGYYVYANGTTADDCAKWISSLYENGWVLDPDCDVDPESPNDVIVNYGTSGVSLNITDFSDGTIDGYVGIKVSYVKPFVPTTSEFPLADANAFLSSKAFGFSLESAIPDAAEAGYIISNAISGGYEYWQAEVKGNQVEAINAILQPIVEAAGYTLKQSSAGYGYIYENEAGHQVRVIYTSDNTTMVRFWD